MSYLLAVLLGFVIGGVVSTLLLVRRVLAPTVMASIEAARASGAEPVTYCVTMATHPEVPEIVRTIFKQP